MLTFNIALGKCTITFTCVPGIKIGHYTTEKRRQDTVEVKQLQAVSALASRMQLEEEKDKDREQLVESIVEAARRQFHNMEAMYDDLSALTKQIQVGYFFLSFVFFLFQNLPPSSFSLLLPHPLSFF